MDSLALNHKGNPKEVAFFFKEIVSRYKLVRVGSIQTVTPGAELVFQVSRGKVWNLRRETQAKVKLSCPIWLGREEVCESWGLLRLAPSHLPTCAWYTGVMPRCGAQMWHALVKTSLGYQLGPALCKAHPSFARLSLSTYLGPSPVLKAWFLLPRTFHSRENKEEVRKGPQQLLLFFKASRPH